MNQVRTEVQNWLDRPEIRLGYSAIGRLVIAAAKCCTVLSADNNAEAREKIRLVLSETENGKKQITQTVFETLPFPEKKILIGECCEKYITAFSKIEKSMK